MSRLIFLLISILCLSTSSLAFAGGTKDMTDTPMKAEESGHSSHTPHPPHDHHDHDWSQHLKRRDREEEEGEEN